MKSKLLRTNPINEEKDVVLCRRACREEAKKHGFNLVDQTRITTAASELARNVYEYAGKGETRIELLEPDDPTDGSVGLRLIFEDQGPGIPDIEKALGEGWTSHRGMGLGLPGAKKLMDEFTIESEVGKGTRVTIVKWR